MKNNPYIRHMSKSNQDKLNSILKQINIPIKGVKMQANCHSLIHFAEIAIYSASDPHNPGVFISVDRVNDNSTHYFVDGVHFYMDFSKVPIKLLIPIQKMVYLINKEM